MLLRHIKTRCFVTLFTIIIVLNLTLAICAAREFEFSERLKNIPSSIKSIDEFSNWLASEFKYRLELRDEWQSPQETIDSKEGDCEDFAILASSFLTKLGIVNDIVIIEFRDLNIGHAVCIWKDNNGTYSFISGHELTHTNKKNVEELFTRYYPDWQKIIFSDTSKQEKKVLVRKL